MQSFSTDPQEKGTSNPGSLSTTVQALSLQADVSASEIVLLSEDANSVTLKTEREAHFEKENVQTNREVPTENSRENRYYD